MLEWMDQAHCLGLDPDLFFPGRGEDDRVAKAVCHGCPVEAICLEYALAHREHHGIWGGRSNRERNRIARRRRLAA